MNVLGVTFFVWLGVVFVKLFFDIVPDLLAEHSKRRTARMELEHRIAEFRAFWGHDQIIHPHGVHRKKNH